MAKNPYQGDDVDYFSAARDKEGGIKQTGLPKSATPKKKPRIVTKEELKKSGFTNLRDFLNAERGLKRRDGKAPERRKTGMDMNEAVKTAKRTREISKEEGTLSDKDRERAQLDSAREASQAGMYGTMKSGGAVKMKGGGSVSSCSKRADGIARKGKTKGRFI